MMLEGVARRGRQFLPPQGVDQLLHTHHAASHQAKQGQQTSRLLPLTAMRPFPSRTSNGPRSRISNGGAALLVSTAPDPASEASGSEPARPAGKRPSTKPGICGPVLEPNTRPELWQADAR